MRCIIPNKIKFVEELNTLIPRYIDNVESVEYVVFRREHVSRFSQEYLVIHYIGGGKTVCSCNGNSFSAILEELAKYLDHGYYGELENYSYYEACADWKKMTYEELVEEYAKK